MTPARIPLPIITVVWWLAQWSRPVVPFLTSVRPKTLYMANVTWSCRLFCCSAVISAPMRCTPLSVCGTSARIRSGSEWLSPPNGMLMTTTGETFMRISVMAAVIWPSASLVVIPDNVSSSESDSERACVREATRLSRYAFCVVVPCSFSTA